MPLNTVVSLFANLSCSVGNYPVLGPQPFECTIKPRNDKLAELIQRELSDSSTLQVEDSTVYEELLMEHD